MIIELGEYNKIRELLIDNGTAGFQGHVSYRDGDQRASVTRVAVHMGEMGMQTWHRGTYNQSLSQE